MAVRERYHKEVFVGEEDQSQTDARSLVDRMATNGWTFDRWYWDPEAQESGEFGGKEWPVLVVWLRWSGEQQDQDILRDEPQVGGWNEGTRQLPALHPDFAALVDRVLYLEAQFKKYGEWITKISAKLDMAEPLKVITGEVEPVSPGPRVWSTQ